MNDDRLVIRIAALLGDAREDDLLTVDKMIERANRIIEMVRGNDNPRVTLSSPEPRPQAKKQAP